MSIGKPSTVSDMACNVMETSMLEDDDQFGKVQVHLIHESAPIMMTSSAKKNPRFIDDDECEIKSDDELEITGNAASPSD